MSRMHLTTAALLALYSGPTLLAQSPPPWNREAQAIAVASLSGSPEGLHEIRAVFLAESNSTVTATGAPVNLSTLVQVAVNGSIIDVESFTIAATPTPASGCGSCCATAGCGLSDCDCDCGGSPPGCACGCWESTLTAAVTADLNVGDEITVILYPAPGALPEPDTADDTLTVEFTGHPVYWDRRLDGVQLVPVPGGAANMYDVHAAWSVEGVSVGFDLKLPFDIVVERNGVETASLAVGLSIPGPGPGQPACTHQAGGCIGVCSPAQVDGVAVPLFQTCLPAGHAPNCCGCTFAFTSDVGEQEVLPGDEITVILRPAATAVPEVYASNDVLVAALPVSIVSANPPADNPFVPGQQPFRDVLQTGSGPVVTQGIGATPTPPQDSVVYATVSVTFSAPPVPPPTPANVVVSCNGPGAAPCPGVLGVAGAGAGPYSIALSGVIPVRKCTTFTFAGAAAGQKLQYQYLPADINYSGSVAASDISALVIAINNGQAGLPANLPHYNVNRAGIVSATDLARLVGLLNGINTTQPWAGATVAACP